MKNYLLSIVAFCLFYIATNAQEVVNGSFELIKPDKAPRAWISANDLNNYSIAITQKPVHSGKYALRIARNKTSSGKGAAIAANVFGSMSAKKLKNVRVTAWVNTDGISDSCARIFIQTADTIIYDQSPVKLKSGWQKRTLSFDVPPSGTLYRFYYGIEVKGNATVVCDDFSLQVDGKQIKDPRELYQEPDDKSVMWLNENLKELKSSGLGAEGLEYIGRSASNARVVGLGEPTHGTSEAAAMKLRTLEYLITTQGFTTIALEEVIPVCDIMNKLLMEPGAAVKDSLINLPMYKLWKTQEMLALFNWVSNYNAEHEIKFVGADMEDVKINSSRSKLRDFGRLHNAAILLASKTIDLRVDSLLKQKGLSPAAMKHADQLREDLIAMEAVIASERQHIQDPEVAFALNSYVNVCKQWLESRFYEGRRDQFMADNLVHYLEAHPREKVLLWAHNFHISNYSIKGEKAMGAYLKEKLDGAYVAISITSAAGRYMATESWAQQKWNAYPFEPAYKGTFEYVFGKAKSNFYFLNLKDSATKRKNAAWLGKPMKVLDLGFIHSPTEDDYKYYGPLSQLYDGVIFIRSTRASTSLLN